MKKKYIYIILGSIVVLFTIGLSIKYNKKDIFSITNKKYLENNLIFEDNTSEGTSNQCLSGINTSTNDAEKAKIIEETYNSTESIFRDYIEGNTMQIIDAKYTNLGYNGYVYLVNGCTWDMNDFIDTHKELTSNDNAVCDTLKNNFNTSKELTNTFNNSNCVTKYNYEKIDYEAPSELDPNEKDGTDSIGDFLYYNNIKNGAKCYYKYSKENTGKTCNYIYDSNTKTNLYLINGCTYDLASYLTTCNEVSENKCGDGEFKNFLINGMKYNNSLSTHITTYNSKCDDTINYGTVIVYQNDDAYGLECDSWEFNETGSCKKSAIQGENITGPNVSNLTRYGTRKFIGWSTDSSCAEGIISNSFNINFTGTKTYYACFEEISSNSILFENNNKKTINETYVRENKTCNEEKVSIIDKYYRKTTEIDEYKTKLNNNNYCNVVCEENVEVTYPNVFETVPAGQYFELVYEPEITATRTCTSEFNYTSWETAYKSAQNAEVSAMDELNKAQAMYDAWSNIVKSTGSGCNCDTCGTYPYQYACNCKDSYYSGMKTNTYINSLGTTLYANATQEEVCGQTSYDNAVSASKENAFQALKTAKTAYKSAVNKRLKLEQDNMQCYTILDQDNNDTKKYEDVFKENYTDITNINKTEYKIKSQKNTLPTSNVSTSDAYATYITNQITDLANDNTGIRKTGIHTGSNTVNFYAVYPKLTFSYDDGSDGEPNIKNVTQVLDVEAHVKLDTGSFTEKNNDIYTKSSDINTISKNFYVNGSTNNHISFNAYTTKSITRQVQYYFTFHESSEYLSKIQSGKTILNEGTIPNNYVSLSKKETYKDKNNNEVELINNVYPISLKAVTDIYDNSFKLENNTGLNIGGSKNNYFSSTTFNTFTGNYQCNYEITNDTLTLSGEKQNYKDLKSNTIFRSVATDNIDPNERIKIGKLGENWTNKKGQAAMQQITTTETNDTTTNDTYNPKNLEYSFTLTPTLIKAIKKYNDTTNYDDFNLTCKTEDGRECVSEFLTNLSNGEVKDGASLIAKQNNYASINSFGEDDLTKIRDKWKYYCEDTDKCKNKSTIVTYKRGEMTLDKYVSQYEMWGVLP